MMIVVDGGSVVVVGHEAAVSVSTFNTHAIRGGAGVGAGRVTILNSLFRKMSTFIY